MQKTGGTMVSVGRAEREEDLALFHEVRKREHERKSNAIHPLPLYDADQLLLADTPLPHQTATSVAKMASSNFLAAEPNGKADDLLMSELGKSDYDWLLTPPGTPLTNQANHNSASDGGDFLSRAEPFDMVQSLAAIKTSRFSSTQAEPHLRKEGATLMTDPGPTSRKGKDGVAKLNGSLGSSVFATNSATTSATRKTPLTPRSGSATRPASPTRRTPISSAHTINPTTPISKNKASSAPTSHPTTPTSRNTAAMASKGGGNSVLSTTRKTGPSSPAATSIKRLSPSPMPNQPLSAGVSRSSSVSKARPQPSRSAPSSRGSSPRGNAHDWHQAFSSNSQNITTPPTLKSNLTVPATFNSRGAYVASSHRPGATTSSKQALFSSLNQPETSMDIPKKACSPSLTRGKCALLKMDRQSSADVLMSRNSVRLDKNQGECVTTSTGMEDMIVKTRRSLGSSVSPGMMYSGVQANHSLDKYMSPTLGLYKHSPQRSLDTAMQQLSMHHQGTSNGYSSLVTSKAIHSSLLGARKVEPYNLSNSFSRASNSIADADLSLIAPRGQGGSDQGEDFMYRSDFNVSPPADQTDILSSFVNDDRMNNWLDSPDCMNEGLDPQEFFEQGLGKIGIPLLCPHGGGAASCELCSVKMRLQMLNEKSKASFGANSQILSEA